MVDDAKLDKKELENVSGGAQVIVRENESLEDDCTNANNSVKAVTPVGAARKR